MKEIHVSLAHCLGPDVFEAIFRNWTLGIRFVRYSAVILHSTVKFSQNWGVSDGPDGWYIFLIVPLGWWSPAPSWTVTQAAEPWTETAKSTAGQLQSCNRERRCTRGYFSIWFRWQGSTCRIRTYLLLLLRCSAVRGWLRWSRWPVWWQNDQHSVLELGLKHCLENFKVF